MDTNPREMWAPVADLRFDVMSHNDSGIIGRLRRVVQVIRLRPFDTSTEQGRANERYRRAALTTIAIAVTRKLSFFAGLIAVPLTIGYLGTERYGLWMTISSLIAMLNFADLGLGNGLLNALATASGQQDEHLQKKYVSSAFVLLTVVCFVLTVALAALNPWIPWPRIFGLSSAGTSNEAIQAVLVFLSCFLLNIPLGLVTRIQSGLQEGFAGSLWTALGSYLSLAGLLWVIHHKGGLVLLVLVYGCAPIIANLANGYYLFFRQRRWLLPSFKDFDLPTGAALLREGLLFFVLQITVGLAYSSDSVILAHRMGAESVATYAVAAKLFSIIGVVLDMSLSPLWPAYGEALARGDYEWADRTLRRSLQLSAAIAVGIGLVFVVFGSTIVSVWTRSHVVPDRSVLIAFAGWSVTLAVGTSYAMFLNGARLMRFQVIMAVTTMVTALIAKFILVRLFGIAGVLWATVGCWWLASGIPIIVMMRRLNRDRLRDNELQRARAC